MGGRYLLLQAAADKRHPEGECEIATLMLDKLGNYIYFYSLVETYAFYFAAPDSSPK